MSESAVSAKPVLLYGLARNRRSPKRPSEPRPSGVHPEEDEVELIGTATRVSAVRFAQRQQKGVHAGNLVQRV